MLRRQRRHNRKILNSHPACRSATVPHSARRGGRAPQGALVKAFTHRHGAHTHVHKQQRARTYTRTYANNNARARSHARAMAHSRKRAQSRGEGMGDFRGRGRGEAGAPKRQMRCCFRRRSGHPAVASPALPALDALQSRLPRFCRDRKKSFIQQTSATNPQKI